MGKKTQQVNPYSNQKMNFIVFWEWHEFGFAIYVKNSMCSNIWGKKINQVLNKDILKNTLNTPMPRYCETVDHKEGKLYSVIKESILIYLRSSFIF